jgi:hypothetical protein
MGKSKKDRQCNGQMKKGQTIQWVKGKKDRQYNGQKKKGQTIQWEKKNKMATTTVFSIESYWKINKTKKV